LTYGPQQQKQAKAHAEGIWLWGIEATQAVERNDTEKVAQLAEVIKTAADNLAQLTERAQRRTGVAR
jgi:hypothetical protein